jgi:hypothetical protein
MSTNCPSSVLLDGALAREPGLLALAQHYTLDNNDNNNNNNDALLREVLPRHAARLPRLLDIDAPLSIDQRLHCFLVFVCCCCCC